MPKASHRVQNSGASALERTKNNFSAAEPNPEDYVLERWLALAEAVLRKRDARADKPQKDETAHPPN